MGLSITIMLSLYLVCTCWQNVLQCLFSALTIIQLMSFLPFLLPVSLCFILIRYHFKIYNLHIIISLYAHHSENVHSLSAYQSNLFTNIAHKIQSHFSTYLIAVLATKFDLFIHYKYTIRIIALPMCKVALFSVKTWEKFTMLLDILPWWFALRPLAHTA